MTIPGRFDELLPRTLGSLAKAGFDEPHLFVDGDRPYQPTEYVNTLRGNAIRPWGNWVMAAWELYIRNPNADRFAIFQDDMVMSLGVRAYLDACQYPAKGYLNLYTFPHNVMPGKEGWYLSNQRGLGAVALVFNNDALRTLFKQDHFVNRPMSRRGQTGVDGGIVDSLSPIGYPEYVHNPSLVQHIGEHSSLNHKCPMSPCFLGEDYDVRTRVSQQPVVVSAPRRSRIGLVGYNCASGLGEVNRQLATYADIQTWLVKPHTKFPSLPPHPSVDTWVCPRGAWDKLEKFVKTVDIVLFAETPYYNTMIELCHRHHRRVVCVPMQEWMPDSAEWTQHVDLFICPNSHSFRQFSNTLPCVEFPWPIDVARFTFQQRELCRRFLFINGHGGWNGRKGAEVVKRAKQLWPEMPLVVRSQHTQDWPQGTEFMGPVDSNADLYAQGDVLLVPHSTDGLGLEPLEAMACGMPCVMTNGEPWNEMPSVGRIESTLTTKRTVRNIDWYEPSAESLVDICKSLLRHDLSAESREVRMWAEERDWRTQAAIFNDLVINGTQGASYGRSNSNQPDEVTTGQTA